MANGLNELLNVQESALRLRESRQQLLASNIANADTPNYKARDINFSATLQQVAKIAPVGKDGQASQSPLVLATTSGAHLSGAGSSPAGKIQYRHDQQGRIDGNNVNTDYERMQFTDNAVRYEATVTLVTAQIRNMLAVVQG